MQDGEEFPHSDRRTAAAAAVRGWGDLLPHGAPVLLGQEEPDVGASLELRSRIIGNSQDSVKCDK